MPITFKTLLIETLIANTLFNTDEFMSHNWDTRQTDTHCIEVELICECKLINEWSSE